MQPLILNCSCLEWFDHITIPATKRFQPPGAMTRMEIYESISSCKQECWTNEFSTLLDSLGTAQNCEAFGNKGQNAHCAISKRASPSALWLVWRIVGFLDHLRNGVPLLCLVETEGKDEPAPCRFCTMRRPNFCRSKNLMLKFPRSHVWRWRLGAVCDVTSFNCTVSQVHRPKQDYAI